MLAQRETALEAEDTSTYETTRHGAVFPHFTRAHFKTGLVGQPRQKKIRRLCHVKNSGRNGKCLGWKKKSFRMNNSERDMNLPSLFHGHNKRHTPVRAHAQAYTFIFTNSFQDIDFSINTSLQPETVQHHGRDFKTMFKFGLTGLSDS